MALVSSATNCRRASKRVAAPENVNPISRPRTANSAPSTAAKPALPGPSGSFVRRIPRRRPISRNNSIPTNNTERNTGVTTQKSIILPQVLFYHCSRKPAFQKVEVTARELKELSNAEGNRKCGSVGQNRVSRDDSRAVAAGAGNVRQE